VTAPDARSAGSWFPVPAEEELPDALRGLFAKARERLGSVPNVFRVYAYRPERLSAWFSHFRLLHEPTDGLGAADRRAAICAYADKLTVRPREVTREDLQSLLDVGLTLQEAWDVAEIAAMYNLTNRMAMATNMLPNENYSAQARPA
jgi:alkylhydroperoxidase family enzyme